MELAGLDKIVGEQLLLLYFSNTSSSIKQRRIPTMADISKWNPTSPPPWWCLVISRLYNSPNFLLKPKTAAETLTLASEPKSLFPLNFALEERLGSVGAEIWMRRFRLAPLPIESPTRPKRFFSNCRFSPTRPSRRCRYLSRSLAFVYLWYLFGAGEGSVLVLLQKYKSAQLYCWVVCFHEAFHHHHLPTLPMTMQPATGPTENGWQWQNWNETNWPRVWMESFKTPSGYQVQLTEDQRWNSLWWKMSENQSQPMICFSSFGQPDLRSKILFWDTAKSVLCYILWITFGARLTLPTFLVYS